MALRSFIGSSLFLYLTLSLYYELGKKERFIEAKPEDAFAAGRAGYAIFMIRGKIKITMNERK
jgi:hypothetical protein